MNFRSVSLKITNMLGLKQRNEDCLYWYFQTRKDLWNADRRFLKSDLYAVAGAKVYLSENSAAKIIRELMKCPAAVARAKARVE